MPAGYIVPTPRFRAFDADGAPLAGGKIATFEAGTSTPLATYTDVGLTVPHANPIVLDANGETTFYIAPAVAYKLVLRNSLDVDQWTVDPFEVPDPEAAVAATPVPTGGMMPFGAAAAPTGFLLCDGSAVSRTTFAALFAVIGTTFGGGDGVTTFNVPDIRQRFVLGLAASGTGNSLAGTGGLIDHVHTGPSHTHDPGTLVTGAPSSTEEVQFGTGSTAASQSHTHTLSGASAAGGTGNTGTANPPFIALPWIIKT
jgi:microcystin-dependent protein